ncbi:MAG: alpha/beta fold hydrolase [Chloroflexi bacterium]|nr:alpha/beta fold hydrolase [Chloroflexota bacterium]
MGVVWVGVALAGVLVLGYVAICGYMVLALTTPVRHQFQTSPEQYGLAYDSVQFPSRVDGVTLDGWLLRPPDDAAHKRPVIVVHGRGSDRTREADGHVLDIAAGLVGDGHPVLVFDLRGSGQSGGEHYTLGAREVWDLGGAIDALVQRGLTDDGVDLLGYSMGGATVLLEAADEPLVRAVVEDSGYADLEQLIDEQLPRASGLPAFFTPGMIMMARPLVGIDVPAIRPIDHVAALAARGVPLLVIHGEEDGVVPWSHGERIAAAYGPTVQTLFVPGAEHVRSYATEPSVYLDTVKRFLDATESR